MRKLYALLAGICFALAAVPTHAQTPASDVANFTYSVDASGNVTFVNTSVIGSATGIRRAQWSFGDGSSQTTGMPDVVHHQYLATGTYTVCLKILLYVNNANEPVVTADVCKTVVIQSICRADFERLSATSTDPATVTLKALPWHSSENRPVLICWNFGDGNDTCIQYSNTFPGPYTVNHTYTHPGEFEVCVKILYQGGCEARKCKGVRIIEPDSCGADFERLPASTANSPLHASFKALPWHNNQKKPSRVCWNFGDGRDTCINYGQDYTGNYIVNHLYQQPGEYNVCVKINYYGGCEAHKCKEIHIERPDSCKADFERIAISTSNNPLTTVFKALPWHNNQKKPKTVCWKFGDGKDTCINYLNIYNGLYTVAHTYSQPGNYEVCVNIVYYGGCEARKCKVVETGRPDSCKADFEKIPVTSSNNILSTAFRALPWHNNNKKPARICWTFGDGRDTCINYGQDYNGPYVAGHTYAQPGEYEVCVKILYYGGCEARKCKVIHIVRPDECKAGFERLPLTTANDQLTTVFKALPWHNNNKKPAKICWTFGDGKDTCINYSQDYTGQYTVSHRYLQPGEYEVCVKIIYYGGCEARKCENIRVPQQRCAVNIFELAQSSTSPERGLFAAVTSEPPRRVERICWTFGDGQ
ncbi:MAG TPA: PKD domain-containing protein, partial [Chitinophagaceae bacterium]